MSIDEGSFGFPNISDIANPDLIALTDVKISTSIDPGLCTLKRSRDSTGAFGSDPEIRGFHQLGNTFIPIKRSIQLLKTQFPSRKRA